LDAARFRVGVNFGKLCRAIVVIVPPERRREQTNVYE
jgi:hypothetical protein